MLGVLIVEMRFIGILTKSLSSAGAKLPMLMGVKTMSELVAIREIMK